MDEAQTLAPSRGFTACTRSTLALSSQARRYGLGLVFATQAPKGLHNQIPGNAVTQFYGLLSAPVQITAAQEMARAKGGLMPDISRLRAGNFYVAIEGEAFRRIVAPWCLSYHPPNPLSPEEVVDLAKGTRSYRLVQGYSLGGYQTLPSSGADSVFPAITEPLLDHHYFPNSVSDPPAAATNPKEIAT
jgi:hypothetical protein